MTKKQSDIFTRVKENVVEGLKKQKSTPKKVIEELKEEKPKKVEVVEYYDEEWYYEEAYEGQHDQPYPFHTYMEKSELAFLKNWLANPINFLSIQDDLAADFTHGAKFVPICGDGNCFFSAVSVSLTAGNEKKFGTKRLHNELRQKTVDHLVKQQNITSTTLSQWLKNKKNPAQYLRNKRSTEGSYDSWSDYITFRAMIESQDRPIVQCTYPRYIDGCKRPDLPPKFWVSNKGCTNQKDAIFIHYNGINHYNVFVPKQYAADHVPTMKREFKSVTTTTTTRAALDVPKGTYVPLKERKALSAQARKNDTSKPPFRF